MATKKKAMSNKGKIRDLPKSKKELPGDQGKEVKGGVSTGRVRLSDITVSKRTDTSSTNLF
jgi:hypothetical protein